MTSAASNSELPKGGANGPWRTAWRRLARNRLAVASLWFLVALVLICMAGPLLSPYAQEDQDHDAVARPPSSLHWLGTDNQGRDMATRVLCGGQVSLLIGAVATLVAIGIGTSYGLVSGLAGRRLDAMMMRLVDILYGLPFLPFVILLTVQFDRNFYLLFVAIGAVEWLTPARVVRGQALALKNQEFVLAARVAGAGRWQVLWRHLLPNVLGTVVVYASLTVPGVMLLEAALSFLGLGVQPPNASWGQLILDGALQMETSPWILLFPGILFISTLLALNTLGDALRDALDPKAVWDS